MPHAFSEIAFTPGVRAEQHRHGSARAYARRLAPEHDSGAALTHREAAFLEARDGFFQATVSETGWPYVQFRGGRPGFLKVLDARTIGYADYRGNQQFISTGNLRADGRVSIIAVDFARRERIKVLGRARISEDPEIVAKLHSDDGPRAERAVLIEVAGYDWNCPQHIPVRRTDAENGHVIADLLGRISDLEEQLAKAGAQRP